MMENGVEDLSEIRGTALSDIKAFDEIRVEPKVSHLNGECVRAECWKCVKGCVYDAISKTNGEVSLDVQKCSGCGLCCGICPDKKIELIWP